MYVFVYTAAIYHWVSVWWCVSVLLWRSESLFQGGVMCATDEESVRVMSNYKWKSYNNINLRLISSKWEGTPDLEAMTSSISGSSHRNWKNIHFPSMRQLSAIANFQAISNAFLPTLPYYIINRIEKTKIIPRYLHSIRFTTWFKMTARGKIKWRGFPLICRKKENYFQKKVFVNGKCVEGGMRERGVS